MKKIMIVEDNADNLDLLVQLLEDRYNLLSVEDGLQAVRTAKAEKPNLILMDMALPGLDGWEATRRIRSDPETRRIPVIGISSYAMEFDELRARQAGCNEYLSKPLDEKVLFKLLDRYLEGG